MKRILFMFLKNIIHVPSLLVRLLRYAANVEKYTEQERSEFLK